MFLPILLATCFVTTLGIEFLDTETLIVRQRPNGDSALFGYSAVLHSLDPSGGMDNMRLMVGAPLEVEPSNNGTMQPTGAVYSCSLTEDECTVLNHTSFYTFNEFEFNNNINQLLGISLHSTGDSFVVCAPRLKASVTESQQDILDIFVPLGIRIHFIYLENMPGRCFIGDRRLLNFNENMYCYNDVGDAIIQRGQCNIGLSMTGSKPESGDNTFVFGMPTSLTRADHAGSFLLTVTNGSSIIREQQSRSGSYLLRNSSCSEASTSGLYAYDGFTVAVGHITSTTRLDTISAQPRFRVQYVNTDGDALPEIIGLVRVASEFLNLTESNCERYNYTSVLYGSTPTEYFGWSLVALDLTGDGYDELLIGAPLYSYVAGALNCLDCGRVYVYRNNDTRNLEYKKDLLGTIPFGRFSYAMTSVGDINYDGWDDFVVSAPLSRTGSESGTIYLYLGAGPSELVSNEYTQRIVGNELNGLASVVSFGSSLSSGYDIDDNRYNDLVVGAGFDETVVVLRTRPIFQIHTNMTASSLSVSFTEPNCVLSGAQNASADGICFSVTFVIRDLRENITADYELTYTLTTDYEAEPRLLFVDSSLQENVLSGTVTFSPSVSFHTITQSIYARPNDTVVSRNSLIALNVMVNDNSGAVIPDSLLPTVLPDPTSITNLTVFLNGSRGCFASTRCQNDLRLSSSVEASGPDQEDPSIILVDVTDTVKVSVDFINVENASCIQTYVNYPVNVLNLRTPQGVECVDDLCFTNTPGSDNMVQMKFEFGVQSYPDDNVSIVFNASSGCSELNETDNVVTVNIPTRRIADLTTSISISPDQQSFIAIPDDSMVDISDALGSNTFSVTVNVENVGPSSSRFATLMIHWPLMDPDESNQFFLYPTRIETDSSVTCGMEHINPRNLNINRRKRQSPSNIPEGVSIETWNCTGDQREDCTVIQCNITGLAKERSTQIIVTSRPDIRTLSRRGSTSQWKLVVFAVVASSEQGNDAKRNDAEGTALINPIPGEIPPSDDGDDGVPIWIIIVAIVVAILFIIIIGIILYCCGFCRRKKRDEEADEEAQKWISASGTPTDLSRENSIRTRTLTDENRAGNIYDNDVNKKEDSIPPEDSDEKSSPPEKGDEKEVPPEEEVPPESKESAPTESKEESAPTESKEEIAPTESKEEGAPEAGDEKNAPPDTNIGSDDGVPLESIGTSTGEGNTDSTTVELACQETDL